MMKSLEVLFTLRGHCSLNLNLSEISYCFGFEVKCYENIKHFLPHTRDVSSSSVNIWPLDGTVHSFLFSAVCRQL